MKVSKSKPAPKRTVVRITETTYELFYLKPVSLGRIEKRGNYWYSSDGTRYISSRDALESAIRNYEEKRVGASTAPTPISKLPVEKPAVPKRKAPVTNKPLQDLYTAIGKMLSEEGSK